MSKIDPPILPHIHDTGLGNERKSRFESVVSPDKFNQLVEALDQTIKMRNTSYTQEQLREEQERLAWYIGQ